MAQDRRSTDAGDLPVVARWGTEHPSAPLVVVLHGNGTSEHSVIEISPWLPHGPVAYLAVRAPIELGAGYRWYLDTDDGTPDPESLRTTCGWLLSGLGEEGDPARPVVLVGFREGVTVAGAVMLAAPERLAGAALLYGALPFEAGPPMVRGGLRGMPVFLGQSSEDTRTPAHLLARTREWLMTESGAPVLAERAAGGAQLAGEVVGHLGAWLGDRLEFLRGHGENPLPDGDEPAWPAVPGARLTERAAALPGAGPGTPPHRPAGPAPGALQEALSTRLAAPDGVSVAAATTGPRDTRALRLDRAVATGPDAAFVDPAAAEFAHLYPDGSLDLALPDELAYDAVVKGWATAHPLAGVRLSSGTVRVPGPRDEAELETVAGIAAAAHRYAAGG